MSEKINETGMQTANGNGVSTVEKKGFIKTQLEKHAAKKEEFAKAHPVAAQRIDTIKKVGVGALIGGAVVKGIELISDAISGSNSSVGYDVIETGSFEEVTDDNNNDTQEVTTED